MSEQPKPPTVHVPNGEPEAVPEMVNPLVTPPVDNDTED